MAASVSEGHRGRAGIEAEEPPVPLSVAIRVNQVPPGSPIGSTCLVHRPGTNTVQLNNDQSFSFDFVEDAGDQEALFTSMVEPLVALVADGYDLTVLAYGQSGSGKTHSLFGPGQTGHQAGFSLDPTVGEAQLGLLPRFVRSLYNQASSHNDQGSFRLRVSYMEIDNDDVRDLLSDCGGGFAGQQAAGNGKSGQPEFGLAEIECDCVSDVLSCLASGQMVRNNSAESSGNPVGPLGYPGMTKPHHFRAKKLHNVFTLNMTFSTGSVVKRSTIRFVDLAPSDQVFGGTTTDLGLLSLNNVVSALGDPRRNVSCIPYQDSLLSRLLREALGGSSLTVAVCTISPLERDADETANTLMYASRMANIRNRPVPRVEPIASEDNIGGEDDDEVIRMTNRMTLEDDKELRSVSSNLGRIPSFNNTPSNNNHVHITTSPISSSFAEVSLPTFDTSSAATMSSLEIQAQALLLRKIEEEKARILDMHRRQQELFQKGLIQQSSIQQLIQKGFPMAAAPPPPAPAGQFGQTPQQAPLLPPSLMTNPAMQQHQYQMNNANNMLFSTPSSHVHHQQFPHQQLSPQQQQHFQQFPQVMSPQQQQQLDAAVVSQQLPPQLVPPNMLVRPDPVSPFAPITQRSTPIDTSPLSHKSPVAVNLYLNQDITPIQRPGPGIDPSSPSLLPMSPLKMGSDNSSRPMEGQPILSPQKLASPKQNNHPRPPTEGSAAAGSPMSQNRDVIHLPLNLQPPPGDVVPQPPQIQPPGKHSGGKKEGGGGERSRRMSEISAAQKLASIVEESEHGSSLSTSGTFTDSSSRPPLADTERSPRGQVGRKRPPPAPRQVGGVKNTSSLSCSGSDSEDLEEEDSDAFDSDEEDLEDEDDFNSEASVVSTEIVENNNAKVRQVLDEFRSANASMAAEAAKKYPLLKPLTRSNTSTTEDSNTNCSASDISSNGNKKKEAEEKLRGEISKLNLNREKTLADRQLVDSELKQVQGQVKELQTSIRVKENLLDDLIGTDKQMKAINRQMVKKIQLLYEESAKTRRDLREAQRCLKEAEESSGTGGTERANLFKERVRGCRQTLADLQQKIESNEESLSLITAGCPTEQREVAQARADMEQMKGEQRLLSERLEREVSRKAQLESQLEADRMKIESLEQRLATQEEQVLLSLKLSQDLKEQRAYLASEGERLREADARNQQLRAELLHEKQTQQLERAASSAASSTTASASAPEAVHQPSYLAHDESRIRKEIGELRSWKESELRSERQYLEHRKEHLDRPELSSCEHCRRNQEAGEGKGVEEDGEERVWEEADEWSLNQLDVMAEVVDAAIDYKNQLITGSAFLYDQGVLEADGSPPTHFLLKKLCALSPGESRHILHKYLERVVDLRTEGRKRDCEMEGLADQLKEYYRIIHHQNHVINVKSMEYERRLDIQKREYLQKLSLLTKSQQAGTRMADQDDPDLVESYEKKVRSLKDELKKTREQAQLYKRFYRENKHRLLGNNAERQQAAAAAAITPQRQSNPDQRKLSRRKSSGEGSEGSQVSAIDAARVEKFQRHVQKMMKEQQMQSPSHQQQLAGRGSPGAPEIPTVQRQAGGKKLVIMSPSVQVQPVENGDSSSHHHHASSRDDRKHKSSSSSRRY